MFKITLRGKISFKLIKLYLMIDFYNSVFQQELPELFEHFKLIDLKPDLYLYNWI